MSKFSKKDVVRGLATIEGLYLIKDAAGNPCLAKAILQMVHEGQKIEVAASYAPNAMLFGQIDIHTALRISSVEVNGQHIPIVLEVVLSHFRKPLLSRMLGDNKYEAQIASAELTKMARELMQRTGLALM